MKSLSQNFQRNKNSLLSVFIIILFFIFFVYLNKEILFTKFDPNIVQKYLNSQDIFDSEDEIEERVFISDSDIYVATGYLYVNGADPRSFNFQHPPFVKYLFGLSIKYFNLPLLPNIVFALFLLLEMLLIGKFVFKSEVVGLLSSIMLMFDPVFKEVTTYALLDLGQMVFLLGFIITTFYYKKHFIGQGVLLGLALASKFYSPVVIFLGLIYLYKYFAKDLNIKREIAMLFIAFLTLCLTYVVSFRSGGGLFNIFFHQAKIIKFMLHHNGAVIWGGVLKTFFGGYFLWPILFFINLYLIFKTNYKDIRFLFYFLPLFYFLIMSFQIPFMRYFVLILPFYYLNISDLVATYIRYWYHIKIWK